MTWEIPGMLYVKVLRSPVHKGLIRNLDVSAAEKMTGVAGVVTAADIPNNAYGMYSDQPVLVDTQIRFKASALPQWPRRTKTRPWRPWKRSSWKSRKRPLFSTPRKP